MEGIPTSIVARPASARTSFFSSAENRAALLVLAAMTLEAIAIFFNGGYFLGTMTIFVVGLWVLAALAVVSDKHSLNPRSVPVALPLYLFAAFWLWTGASIFWSIASDLTWIEFNRTGGYLAAFVLGLAVGRHRLARRLAVFLFLFAVAEAAVYALGTKAAPSIVANLNNLGRVSVPIGYANGTGLLLALPFPFALYAATSKRILSPLRILATLIALLLLISLFFTSSRGAIGALAIGLVVYFIASPLRQRGFFMLSLVLVPVVLIAIWAYDQPALMLNKVVLKERLIAAANLRPNLLVIFTTVGIISVIFLYLGRKITFSKHATWVSGLTLLVLLIISTFISLGIFISSKPSFGQYVTQKYDEIFALRPDPNETRLFSLSLNGRLALWKEALSNWQVNQFKGSGAQSFPLTHLLTRSEDTPFAKQAHSMYLSWLTELGLIGFFLGSSFVIAILTVSILLLRKIRERWERGLAAAILAMNVIYLIHTSYDWDWNIFVLTMPCFLFSGVLIGWLGHIESEKG